MKFKELCYIESLQSEEAFLENRLWFHVEK